jgi:hypothetical protein
MVAINNEYDYLFTRLFSDKDKKAGHSVNDNFRSIVDILMQDKFSSITIEIVGSWIWLSGNTFNVKDEIKELNFKWSKNNKKWYLGEVLSKKKGRMTWEQKVNLYGVQVVKEGVQRKSNKSLDKRDLLCYICIESKRGCCICIHLKKS